MSDLSDHEREDLRAAAGALIGLGAGAVLGDEAGAVAGAELGAEAALDAGEIGLSDEDILALGEGMEIGDALLLLVLENVWASGLRNALQDAGLVFAKQDYLAPSGLVALGEMLGLEVAMEEGA